MFAAIRAAPWPDVRRARPQLKCGAWPRFTWRVDPMDDYGVISQAESDEEILAFDVSDEALERSASTEQQAFTWIYCTGGWQYCPA